MMNLFSSFDPSTYKILSMNWASMLIPLIIFPILWWVSSTRIMFLINFSFKIIQKENKSILDNSYIEGSTMFTISLIFILFSFNFMGLSMYTFTPSSHLTISLSLAFSIWISFIIFSMMNFPKTMMTHMTPTGTPFMLMNFMVIIETISNLIRPITLSVRLSANMIAGHLLLTLIGETFNSISGMSMILIYLTQSMLMILEMAVAMIQAYVFITLISLYLTEIH